MIYQDEYQHKLASPDQAVKLIESNSIVVMGMAVSEPPALLKAFAERAIRKEINNVRVYYYHSMNHAEQTILQYELLDRIHPYCFIVSEAERSLIKRGIKESRKLINYVPIHFSQSPRLFTEIGV